MIKNTKLLILLITVLVSCSGLEQKPDVMSFNGRNGLIYFSYPTEGQTILAVFLPYSDNQKSNQSIEIFDNKFEPGIKIATSSLSLWDKLSQATKTSVYQRKTNTLKFYYIPNAEIYYHVTKPMFNDTSVISKGIEIDTLSLGKKQMAVKYYFSYVTIDDIKVKN